MRTKREVLEQDRTATTYFERQKAEAGRELGRWSHLADQVVTGSGVPVYPRQSGTPWSDSYILPDEPPNGVDLEAVPDMETVDGLPRQLEGSPQPSESLEALPSSEPPIERGDPSLSSAPKRAYALNSETEPVKGLRRL